MGSHLTAGFWPFLATAALVAAAAATAAAAAAAADAAGATDVVRSGRCDTQLGS